MAEFLPTVLPDKLFGNLQAKPSQKCSVNTCSNAQNALINQGLILPGLEVQSFQPIQSMHTFAPGSQKEGKICIFKATAEQRPNARLRVCSEDIFSSEVNIPLEKWTANPS